MRDLDLPELTSFEVPDRTFKIGEVGKLLGLETHTLRYWEEQFDLLDPPKTETGQRTYGRSEIELLSAIQMLLHEEKFTTEGAQRQLELARSGDRCYLRDVLGEGPDEFEEGERLQKLQDVRDRLRERVEDLQGERDRAAEARDEAVEQRDEAVEQRDEALEQRQRLRRRVEDLEERLEAAEEREVDAEAAEEWRNAARRLQNEVDSLEDDLQEARSTIERLARERDREAERNGVADEVVDELQREVQQLRRLARPG